MTINFENRESPLKQGAFAPNRQTLAKTFWLYKRNTSVTYIGRMIELVQNFMPGFKDFVAKQTEPGAYLTALSEGHGALGQLETGLMELKKGNHSGYFKILNGIGFRDLFYYGRFGGDMDYSPLGKKGDFDQPNAPTSIGLWCWMENALQMTIPIESALSGKLWYPLLDNSKFKFPDIIGGYPLRKGICIRNGDDIPISGIWEPLKIKGGCPNYFTRGRKAPPANIAVSKFEEIRTDTDNPGSSRVTFTHYNSAEFPCTWELVWEDTRYRDGKIPLEEQEYLLDDYTQFPKDPPVAPGP